MREGDKVQVLNGVRPGDEVVVVGGIGLDDKAKVRVVEAGAQKPTRTKSAARAGTEEGTKKSEEKPKAK